MGQAIRDKNEREKTFALIFKWEGGELYGANFFL